MRAALWVVENIKIIVVLLRAKKQTSDSVDWLSFWNGDDSARLGQAGYLSDLAAYYANAGWLQRLGRGVYARPSDRLEVLGCLTVLQDKIKDLHVGGQSALDWHGIRHFVAMRPTVRLYGSDAAKLPDWFTSRFPATYRRQRIFREASGHLLHVNHFRDTAVLVSAPERALLEFLSEVGVRSSLEHARLIVE